MKGVHSYICEARASMTPSLSNTPSIDTATSERKGLGRLEVVLKIEERGIALQRDRRRCKERHRYHGGGIPQQDRGVAVVRIGVAPAMRDDNIGAPFADQASTSRRFSIVSSSSPPWFSRTSYARRPRRRFASCASSRRRCCGMAVVATGHGHELHVMAEPAPQTRGSSCFQLAVVGMRPDENDARQRVRHDQNNDGTMGSAVASSVWTTQSGWPWRSVEG